MTKSEFGGVDSLADVDSDSHLPSVTSENYADLYAIQYRPKETGLVKRALGWALFDFNSEYSRMGLPNEHWRYTTSNKRYEVISVGG